MCPVPQDTPQSLYRLAKYPLEKQLKFITLTS